VVVVAHDASLAWYTTFGVGGPAWGLADASSAEELQALQELALREGRPMMVLGGGSNVLVADAGYPGLVVRYRDARVSIGEEGLVQAGAGAVWDEVVAATVALGFVGIECLSGIPGWAGAAPIQNIGAYGQEIAETLLAVHAFDLRSGAIDRLVNSACGFGYRSSRFKEDWKDRYVVTGVELQLRARVAPAIEYAELAQRLADGPIDAPRVRQTVLGIRRSKSMVIDPQDENRRSAGSFFMNPIVPAALADEVERIAGGRPPRYPAGEGREKLSAAWLIERAGFSKGYGDGAAGLSTNHCLALVNRGGARAADLVRLAAEIRRGVRAKFGVTLVPEPVFVGFPLGAEALLDSIA
jgi:UDP-N-acetylmuramate dehydrogenase